jgi:hypothetical protein
MNDSLREALAILGLPYHSGPIYIHLTKSGPLPMSDLKGAFKNKITDFEKSINWLVRRGYIYEEMDDEGVIRYIAFDPAIVSRALFDEFLWTKMRFHVISDTNLSRLSPMERSKILLYKKACDDFVREISPHYVRSKPVSGMTYIKNEKQLSAILSRAISNASKSVFGVVVSKWTPNIPLIWESLKLKMAEGIPYRRVSDESTFISFGYSINIRDTEKFGVKLKLLNRSEITQKFYLIDDNQAIVFWGGLPFKDFEFEGTLIDNRAMVKRLGQEADRLWNEGVPSIVCLNYMKELREQFLQKAMSLLRNKNKLKFAEELFDFGVFCKCQTVSSIPLRKEILEKLHKNGLLVRVRIENYPYGDMPYLPNIAKEFSAFLRSKGVTKPVASFAAPDKTRKS